MSQKLTQQDINSALLNVRAAISNLEKIDEELIPSNIDTAINDACGLLEDIKGALQNFDLDEYNDELEDADDELELEEESEEK